MNFIKKNWLSVLIGCLAGLINGLLGAGGGIIITYYLSHVLTNDQKKGNIIFANAVATMLPISIVSFGFYLIKGYITLDKEILSLIPAAVIGGILGAFLLTKLRFKTIKIIFAFLVTISGLLMIFK
jgi:uncharacterized membrane protein YfcA